MHHPFKSVLTLIATFGLLALMAFVYPKEGVQVSSSLSLNFPSLDKLFGKKEKKVDISGILALADKINATDSLMSESDTLSDETETSYRDTIKPNLITSIQFKNKEAFNTFFEALKNSKTSEKSIRVLHYGDSQIECDRITDYLRLKLQSQFGGNGPGLISLMPVSRSLTNKITNGYGWDRFQTFTGKDKRVEHSNFGYGGNFTRFCQYKPISDTSTLFSTNVLISSTKLAGSNNLGYKKIKLFYGGSKVKTYCEFYDGPALAGADSLKAGGIFNIKEFNVSPGSHEHEFKFKGLDSPDFYGVSLESNSGIYVDNISQRGSSGTFFHRINFGQLKTFYEYLNVKLIILQYGGNVLPAIKDKETTVSYANYIKRQIAIVKKAAPGVSILFIGPADMSVKDGADYVTHPYLEDTRNAIKQVVLDEGCAYFDMYDCMGGKNSMVTWVDEKMAAPDYIHFSPQGARKIATLLYSSLIWNYNNYLKTKGK